MADLYRRKVEQLEMALKDASVRPEATGILRSMIEHIGLTPEEGASQGLRIEVQGDLRYDMVHKIDAVRILAIKFESGTANANRSWDQKSALVASGMS